MCVCFNGGDCLQLAVLPSVSPRSISMWTGVEAGFLRKCETVIHETHNPGDIFCIITSPEPSHMQTRRRHIDLIYSDLMKSCKYEAAFTKNVIEMGRVSLAVNSALASCRPDLPRRADQNHAHALDSGDWSLCLLLPSGVNGAEAKDKWGGSTVRSELDHVHASYCARRELPRCALVPAVLLLHRRRVSYLGANEGRAGWW